MEHDAHGVAPRTTEIVRFCRDGEAVLRCDRAGVEDVPGWVGSRVAAVGCDGSRGDSANVDLLEPRGGFFAVDEVYGADDEGLGVELVSCVSEERVLVYAETARLWPLELMWPNVFSMLRLSVFVSVLFIEFKSQDGMELETV